MIDEEILKKAANIIASSNNIIVFTGAGISTESSQGSKIFNNLFFQDNII